MYELYEFVLCTLVVPVMLLAYVCATPFLMIRSFFRKWDD